MNRDTKSLTVVIPVRNRASVVGRTLDSLDAQTSRDFCVILVDNGSTDGTLTLLHNWAEISDIEVRIFSEPRTGAAAARRRGMESVDTEWTMSFDSDDIMSPTHIEEALAYARSHDCDIIGRDIFYRHGGPAVVKPFISGRDIAYRVLFDGTMSTQRYFARTDLFLRAGNWDGSIGTWDDIELAFRMLALNPRIEKIKGQPTVEVNIQPDSMTVRMARPDKIEPALRSIERQLGPERRHWTDLKRVIFAANMPDTEGHEYYRQVISHASRNRLLLQMAYAYTRRGGRGIARLLRPFM